jgi:hypothetical protein
VFKAVHNDFPFSSFPDLSSKSSLFSPPLPPAQLSPAGIQTPLGGLPFSNCFPSTIFGQCPLALLTDSLPTHIFLQNFNPNPSKAYPDLTKSVDWKQLSSHLRQIDQLLWFLLSLLSTRPSASNSQLDPTPVIVFPCAAEAARTTYTYSKTASRVTTTQIDERFIRVS